MLWAGQAWSREIDGLPGALILQVDQILAGVFVGACKGLDYFAFRRFIWCFLPAVPGARFLHFPDGDRRGVLRRIA